MKVDLIKRRTLTTFVFLIILAYFLLAGCGETAEIETPSEGTQESAQQHEQKQEQELQAEKQEDPPVSTGSSVTEEESTVVSVIVKSENNLSDSEKQEIMDELSLEVDELLEEINSIEQM